MKSMSLLAHAFALAAIALFATQPASAAYISIDAFSVPGQVTMLAGDFEAGITVNGQSTSGLGNRVTVAAADTAGPVTFSGSWVDEGLSTPGSFAQVTTGDELVYTVSSDGGSMSTIAGEFCADPTVCSVPAGATVSSVGAGPNIFNQSFLTASWQSAPVPEPMSIVLLGVALTGLSLARRGFF